MNNQEKIAELEKRVDTQETIIVELKKKVELLMRAYYRNLPMR